MQWDNLSRPHVIRSEHEHVMLLAGRGRGRGWIAQITRSIELKVHAVSHDGLTELTCPSRRNFAVTYCIIISYCTRSYFIQFHFSFVQSYYFTACATFQRSGFLMRIKLIMRNFSEVPRKIICFSPDGTFSVRETFRRYPQNISRTKGCSGKHP